MKQNYEATAISAKMKSLLAIEGRPKFSEESL
jgi:hypothetical protein